MVQNLLKISDGQGLMTANSLRNTAQVVCLCIRYLAVLIGLSFRTSVS